MTIDVDERKVARNEAGLWLGWTFATAAGMALGFIPTLLLVDILPLWLFRILVPLWAGFLVGLFQWFALRGYLTHSADWILNGGAGWALAYALGLMVIQVLNESTLGIFLSYILFGIIIGIIQWPALRREIPNVIPWVLGSIVGWSLGAFVSQLVLGAVVTGETASQLVSTAVISIITGLVAGAVTGLALIWIVRQPEYADFKE